MPKPKVLVLASQKGGVGKTSLTAHLAVAAEAAGIGPVVLYDTDPQASLEGWHDAREAETPKLARNDLAALPSTLERLGAAGVPLVVVDTPPAISGPLDQVLPFADFVLIPTQDGMADLRAVARTVRIVRDKGVPYAFALNFVKIGTRQAAQASMFLSKHGPVAGIVAHRMAYKVAWNTGQTAPELEGRRSKAHEEIGGLWAFVAQELGFVPEKKKEKVYA